MFQQIYESLSRKFISCYKNSIFIQFSLLRQRSFGPRWFSTSSCMMLRSFSLRLMNFMISYRIRSCIYVASPQCSAKNDQTELPFFLTMAIRTWSLNTILLLILRWKTSQYISRSCKCYGHKVTNTQKLLLKQMYAEPIYSNNLLAMTMWQEPLRIGADI